VDFPKPPILESLTPVTRILFSVLLVISCFAITFFAGLLLAGPLFGIGMQDIIASLSDVENLKTIRVLQYFQVIQAFGLFILPAMLAGYLFGRNIFGYLALDRSPRWLVYLLTLALMFACLPFVNWLITMNEAMKLPDFLSGMEEWMKNTEEQAAKLTEAFMNMPSFGALVFNMVMIAILPALGEEFLFRGLLQRLLKEWLGNIHAAVFLSAILFSALHMQFYGFIPRMMLGVMFGYLFYWSGSLWIPVWAHFINNGSAVIAAYLGQHGMLSGNYEDFGSTENVVYIILSGLAMLGFMYFIYRQSRQKHADSRIL
jgi:membrane protease YdiL (CAAX protease family)